MSRARLEAAVRITRAAPGAELDGCATRGVFARAASPRETTGTWGPLLQNRAVKSDDIERSVVPATARTTRGVTGGYTGVELDSSAE